MSKKKEDYALDFGFKKTVWNKYMIVKFNRNEDLGKVAPVTIKMKNFVM